MCIQKFFDYVVISPSVRIDSAITTARGKIYALFVKTPTRLADKDPELSVQIARSFKMLYD